MTMQDDIDTLKGVVAWLTNELAGADHDALERVVDAIDGGALHPQSLECDRCAGTGITDAKPVEDLDPDQSLVEAWGYPCSMCDGTGHVAVERWVGPWKETADEQG